MFVRAANPIWYFVDLQGLGLNDQYYISFLTNTFPYLPQPVYHTVNGTEWSNPLQFYPNGTLPDNLYFDPNLVYRLEIRKGPTQSDPLIYEINNFTPGNAGGNIPPSLGLFNTDNEISNSQFTQILFSSPLTITTAGIHEIAPDWFLNLAGTGSTTITLLVLTGNQNIINNPPYAIRFNNSGWSSAILFQRLHQNGAIWANGAVAFSLLARSGDVSSHIITVNYVPNPPASPPLFPILSKTVTNANFQVISGALNVGASDNNVISDLAYVDIQIVLPNGIVELSNAQLVGQDSTLSSTIIENGPYPDYIQEPPARQIDHLFHFYRDSILREPKHNLLTGWNFSQNPWQFITTANTVVSSQTQYIADQTILHQETAGSLSSQKSTSANTHFNLVLTTVNGVNNNRFALIQYMDWRTIIGYFGQNLSAFVRARLFHVTGNVVTANFKMRLIYRTTGDAIPSISNTEPITGWDVNGDVIFAAGWSAIEPLNDVFYPLPNFYASSGNTSQYPGMTFDQFPLPDAPSVTPYLGIVLYTTANLDNTLASEDKVSFDRISLVPNDFGIDASPETFDETLRKCQYYYEKSYQTGDLPGTATAINLRAARSGLTQTNAVIVPDIFAPFTIFGNYETKNKIPSLSFYSQTGSSGVIDATLLRNGGLPPVTGANPIAYSITNFNFNVGINSFEAFNKFTSSDLIQTTTPTSGDEAIFSWHFVADSRLGA